jgi:Leucine-rich repeat (LRR) protein
MKIPAERRLLPAFTALVLLLILHAGVYGQAQKNAGNGRAGEAYTEQVRQLVVFLQYVLNELGSDEVPVSDKEIIINESYLKVFRDEKVQIEDDLDENREVVTNKDVQAYLKDVDFFFRGVQFEFRIQDIREGVNEAGQLFYTVKLNRRLIGKTIDDEAIDNQKERFIEINVDEKSRELKIASVYTTRLSRTDELKAWWNALPAPWKLLLGAPVAIDAVHTLYDVWSIADSTITLRGVEVPDTFNIAGYLRQIADREELDISNTRRLGDLAALDQMNDVRVLNISNTEITDLFPVRNLTRLEVLDASNTLIEDLAPLQYSRLIRDLSISGTPVNNITVLESFLGLEKLNLHRTVIDSLPSVASLNKLKYLDVSSTNLLRLDSLRSLTQLEYLDVSNTAAADLSPVSDLQALKYLAFNETAITDLRPLAGLRNLESISFFNTPVASLQPLVGLEKLRKVYCDGSRVTREEFVSFYRQRPDCEVIFSSDQLMEYWTAMDVQWQAIIMKAAGIEEKPDKEKLHEIFRIQSIELNGDHAISSLEPLSMLVDLRYLNAASTGIRDLTPLRNQTALEYLDCSHTAVSDLAPLSGLARLRILKFDGCPVASISPLVGNSMLDSLFFNGTQVSDISALEHLPSFKAAYFDSAQVNALAVRDLNFDPAKSLIVFRSAWLQAWWDNMPGQWQNLFMERFSLDQHPDVEALHRLTMLSELKLNTLNFTSLSPLLAFDRLRVLHFSDSRVSSLQEIRGLELLEELHCPRNPVADLNSVASLYNLRVLNIENTLVQSLDPVAGLTRLEELNCSGTGVKDLSPLAGLSSLRVLEFSNTKVRNLKAILGLDKLEVLRCYNNRISAKAIEEFRVLHPGCEVVFY